MSDFFNSIMLLMTAAFVLLLLSVGVDWLSAKPVFVGPGIVKQMVFVPATHSIGTATTFDQNSSTAMVSSSTYEAFQVIVTVKQSTFSVDTPADQWGQLAVGAAVDVYEYQGRVFGGRFRRYVMLKE